MRVKPGINFYYRVIHQGDVVKLNTVQGKTTVVIHEREFDNLGSPITGAYCGVITDDGEDLGVEVMTIADIETSWSMSKTYNRQRQEHPCQVRQGHGLAHSDPQAVQAHLQYIRRRRASRFN